MQFLVGGIEDGLRTLSAWICEWLYTLIAGLYDLFINISRVELLQSEQIQPIYQRITMILAIVMVFYVTFEAVKFVIQPDQFTDKEKGAPKIVLKMVLVVIFIAFVPQIFSGAYWVQNKIFDTQVFSKVILGQTNIDNEQLGRNLAYNIFNMFYYTDTESFTKEQLEEKNNCEGIPCQQVVTINLYNLQQHGQMPLLQMGLNENGKTRDETTNEDVKKYYISFNGLFAVGVGVFIVYMLLLYCVDAGVRVVQMLFLQIIAPIPIMGYLAPKKDGIFEKWLKQCITTYLDLFLRVGIIHFVLLICQILGDAFADGSLFEHIGSGTTGLMKMFMYIALIMGLLLFAHKAPKMLGELFPKGGAASGNFGLKAGERVAPEAARLAGAALGSTRAIGGLVSRGMNKHIRNKANGARSIFSKEGREQLATRWKNKGKVIQQRHNNTLAQNVRNRVSDEEVMTGKKKVQAASEALKNARATGDATKISAAEENLKRVSNDYRQMMNKRNNSPGINLMKGNIKATSERLDAARQELAAAELTGDQKAIDAAKRKVDNVENALRDKTGTYRNILSGDAHGEEKAKLDDAISQVAEDNNTKYGSAIGSALWGAVAGGVTGAAGGAKATKLEEIIPKVKEAHQKDVKKVQELNKYYDNGGNVGFVGGTIDRTVSKVSKDIGLDTPYARINLDNQRIERNIKEIDSSISRADNVKKEFDATEDRLKSKLDDNKVINTGNEAKTYTTKGKTKVTVAAGQNYADVSREFKAKAKNANAVSEAASKELQEKESKISTIDENQREKYRRYINGEFAGPLTSQETAELSTYNEYHQAKINADKKAEEAVQADRDAKEVEKLMTRAIFTEMLNDPKFEEKAGTTYDGVAVQTLKRDYNEIRIANQDVELRRRLENSLSTKDYMAFMNCKFENYDQMDTVLVALANAKSALSIEKQSQQDQKHRNESSNATQAQKAANDYNGSGK